MLSSVSATNSRLQNSMTALSCRSMLRGYSRAARRRSASTSKQSLRLVRASNKSSQAAPIAFDAGNAEVPIERMEGVDVLAKRDCRILRMKEFERTIEMSITRRRRERDRRHLHPAKVIEQSSADRIGH